MLYCAGPADGSLHVLEEVVDLALGDLDLAVHLALAQPRDQDLVADVVAELLERHPLPVERRAKVGKRQLVLLGNHLHRPVDLLVVGAHAGVPRVLHLHTVADHALEHLALEHVGGREAACPGA